MLRLEAAQQEQSDPFAGSPIEAVALLADDACSPRCVERAVGEVCINVSDELVETPGEANTFRRNDLLVVGEVVATQR